MSENKYATNKNQQPDDVVVANLIKLKWELWERVRGNKGTPVESEMFWKINSCLFRDENGELDVPPKVKQL